MSPVAATALSGLQIAKQRFAAAAGRIARAESKGDVPKDIVDLLTARRDFEANLLVLKVEADMMDRLLDIRT